MRELAVTTPVAGHTYPIVIGKTILKQLKEFISQRHKGKKVVVITDDIVDKLYYSQLQKYLPDPFVMVVPHGEQSKCRSAKDDMENKLLEKQYGRDTLIIAFGGGVIGDLAGFIAATYMRGVPYIQVPTSLLAMVDSSIGGKTSINTDYGKNLIGAIWQPDAVFSELSFLDHLPDDELRNGLAESIKMSYTSDKELFEYIQENKESILSKNTDVLVELISRSVTIKRGIVEQDEREAGIRQVLNFGHTIGHALEAFFSYQSKHGYCVSLGMVAEARLAVLNGLLSEKDEGALVSVLKDFGLPVLVEGEIKTDKVLEMMKSDKKAKGKEPYFVVPLGIGEIKQEKEVFSYTFSESQISKALYALVP